MDESKSIVLFDGVCNLCNGAVNFIIDRDRENRFVFGSLQSQEGQELIKKYQIPVRSLESMVLIEGRKYYLRSTAALRVAKNLSGIWPVFSVFIIIPAFLRDLIYNAVASSRYVVFGRSDECRIPTPQLKEKFLS